MPLNLEVLSRRRRLLGMTQNDLAITAGISPSGLQRLEAGQHPEGGGKTGIDVVQRIAAALQMDIRQLLIMPEGNRYQAAVQYARAMHSPVEAPKYHDRRRTILAEGYRKLSGAPTALELIPDPPPVEDIEYRPKRDAIPDFTFTPDPSTE